MEDRPKRIKVEVLPYDDCDVVALLMELVTARVPHPLRSLPSDRELREASAAKYQGIA